MTQELLKQVFDQVKARIDATGQYHVAEEPVIDLEYNLVIFTIRLEGQWKYTGNLWIETCRNCGLDHVEFELYEPEQGEESDPDPIFETGKLDELITFLRG